MDGGVQSCVEEIAGQLIDPGAVTGAADGSDAASGPERDELRKVWDPASLAVGYPGISLLFSELSYQDESYRSVAHRYLELSLDAIDPRGTQGLYSGLTAVAFALRAAQRTPRDYQAALAGIEKLIEAYAGQVLAAEGRRLAERASATTFAAYDSVSGLTGIGRYFLLDPVNRLDVLRRILTYLVGLTEPVWIGRRELPGWWVGHPAAMEEAPGGAGHVNFGMAHGAAGVLALLSLSWASGTRVPGQEAAMSRIADWFLKTATRDEFGVRWPSSLKLSEYLDDSYRPLQRRPSWCYGSPGIARSLQLAGMALGEVRWLDCSRDALLAALRRLDVQQDIRETGICHGWAGLLHTVHVMNRTLDLAPLDTCRRQIARTILDSRSEDARFSFRVRHSGDAQNLDVPGFLDGAAGTALALMSSICGDPPKSGWDRALLLS
nr:lanthionine synthetase C family protein [Streptomyces sp. SID8381]